jgi:DNA-directed RNA polymerase specialized sigma24 family protein
MIDDATLFDFSRSCAREYCRRFNSANLDDATQEASLYLLEHRDRWSRPRNYLRKRVVYELVRRYQNEIGLRRKNKLRKVEFDVFQFARKKRDDPDAEEAREIIEEAIKDGKLEQDREIVELIVDGWTRSEIAGKYDVKFWEISDVYKRFLHALQKIEALDKEPTEQEKKDFPLLYLND